MLKKRANDTLAKRLKETGNITTYLPDAAEIRWDDRTVDRRRHLGRNRKNKGINDHVIVDSDIVNATAACR